MSAPLSRSARAVLRRILASRSWDRGQAALAQVVDYSVRTVRRALGELCAAGMIARTCRSTARGRASDAIVVTALGEALMVAPPLAYIDDLTQPMQLAVGCPPLAARTLPPTIRSEAVPSPPEPPPLSRAAVDRPARPKQKKRRPEPPAQLQLQVVAPPPGMPQDSPGPAGPGNERMVRGPAGGADAKKEARETAKRQKTEEKAARAAMRARKSTGADMPALPEVLAAWRESVAAARPPLLAAEVIVSGRAISAARGYVGRLLRLVAVGRPLADGDREEVVRRARALFTAALATERPSFPLGLEIVCANPDRYQGAVRKGPMTLDERRALALQGCGHVKPGREMGNTGDPESRARTLAKLAAMGIKRDA